MDTKGEYEEFIQKAREERVKKRFEGTFLDYVLVLEKNPSISQLAHSRIYDIITQSGIHGVAESNKNKVKKRRVFVNDSLKIYPFFVKEFFGMEKAVSKIVRFFHSASLKGEESRQVLYLVGPVGAGKSSLMDKIKQGLENAESIYGIKGCPMQEEPLHLVPRHLRPEFEKRLNIHIEGDLCPVCRYRLREEYNNEFERFPVTTFYFSKRARLGIGVVPPIDPNNQDTSVLIGSEDISKLDIYPEGDPRALSLNGAFSAGNRGVVEFIEVFKNETEFLHIMITATQEKMIPAPGQHSMIYFDGVIVAHSNEAEWNKFKADHTNEAIMDRIVTVEVPYVLELDEEVKIYKKIIDKSNFKAHIAPHTLAIASMFAILTRLHSTNKCDLLTKLKLYNGEEVIEKGTTKLIDASELIEDAPEEGMTGISTRFIMKSLDDTLSDSEHDCINPISVRESIIQKIKEEPLPDDLRKKYLEFLQDTMHKEYLRILEKEITKSFVHSYEAQAETLFDNYLDHAEAFVNKTKVKDAGTKEELEPNEELLKSIEEQIGILGSAADGFRQDLTSFMFSVMRKKEKINYRSYAPLKEAIENKLISSVKDISRVITKATTRDKEQKQKHDLMVERMIKDYGYCPHCCEVILHYASNHLWKD